MSHVLQITLALVQSRAVMSVAVVLGAGDLGGTLAHALARRDRFREVRLIDKAERVAEGLALDITQAGPIEGFGTRVSACADEAAARDATVLLLADAAGAPSHEWTGETGLDLLRRTLGAGARAPIVCAGPAAAWLVERAVAELDVPRTTIVGSAPAALAAALAVSVGLEAQVSPQHVELWLAGQPPDRLVVAWEEGSIAGERPSSVLGAGVLARIRARVPLLWPPGAHALASAGARVAEALLEGTRRQLTCFTVLDGEASSYSRVAAVPIRFRKGAVAEVTLPALSPGERTAFENVLASRR